MVMSTGNWKTIVLLKIYYLSRNELTKLKLTTMVSRSFQKIYLYENFLGVTANHGIDWKCVYGKSQTPIKTWTICIKTNWRQRNVITRFT